MNIDTDTQFAFSQPVGQFVEDNHKAFKYQVDPADGTPYKKFYDPRKYLRLAEQGIVQRLQEACEDLGCSGKSIARR
jgi:fructose-bisphosphate aldolase class II